MTESIGLIERAAALLRERGTGRFEEPSPVPSADAEGGAQAPVILDPVQLARRGIALPSEARSRTVEEFRLIKRNLMALWSKEGSKVNQRSNRLIMVTSAQAAEGKTFVSINLALAFASETDGEAVLIDTDTERPMLRSLFGITADKGIVDVLAGRLELSDVLLRTSLPNLAILPSGSAGPHVPELFSGKRMSLLLTNLAERSRDHFIIIDTPPCLATSEAASLAPLVGQILLVAEAHRTQRPEIESSLALLSSCPNICLLLNKSDAVPKDYYGSYGYYFAKQ